MRDAPRALGAATTALVIVLTVVAVIGAGHAGNIRGGAIFGATFLAVYLAGALSPFRFHENWAGSTPAANGRGWAAAWLGGMGAAWVGLLLVSNTAMWLAFPLILLQVGALGLGWGSAAAFLTAAVSSVVSLQRLPVGASPVGPLLGPALGALIAVTFMWGVTGVSRESKAREEALEQLVQARALLADAEAEQVASRERQRLAGELHDTVVQGISAVSLLLNAAEQIPAGNRKDALVAQALEASQENLVEARRITTTLGPAELESARLPAALQSLANRSQTLGVTGAKVEVVVEGEADLHMPEEMALLRVAQSALWNAKEHAEASLIEVRLISSGDKVSLKIVDDGIGFQEKVGEGDRGTGIPTMEARMNEVGGTLKIHTSNSGTVVEARLPLHGSRLREEVSRQ